MSTINLGDVSNRSIVLTVRKLPMQINPEAMTGVCTKALNPDALAEIYSDNHYRNLKFEQLEQR